MADWVVWAIVAVLLAVGEIFYQQPPSPFVVWFDDLAINDTQIGCQ